MIEQLARSNRWFKLSLILPSIVLNGWVILLLFQYFEPFVTILIVAAILAFILNYPVDFLLNRGFNRSYAVLSVLLISAIGAGTLAVTLVPILLEQLSTIVKQLPTWWSQANQELQVVQVWATAHGLPINLSRIIHQSTDRLPDQIQDLGDETVALTLNAAGGVSSILLTLVLTLYLLLDGKRVWQALFRLVPLSYRDRIQRSLSRDLHNYFVGQVILSVILGVVYSIAFLILQVPYSLLFGFSISVLGLIPFGDTLGYLFVCLFLVAQSPHLVIPTLITSVILDQIIDQVIAPRVLSNLTGLKPVWVILALLFGARVFGLPGLLLAVPIASFVGNWLEDEMRSPSELILPEPPTSPLEEASKNYVA